MSVHYVVIGIDADVQICELDGHEINQPELLTGIHKLKLMETDEYSIGYETMTTVSDTGSVVSCYSMFASSCSSPNFNCYISNRSPTYQQL